MALARDIPITREHVHGWVRDYNASTNQDKGTLEEYVTAQITALKLPEDTFEIAGIDGSPTTTTVVDAILEDLRSYTRGR